MTTSTSTRAGQRQTVPGPSFVLWAMVGWTIFLWVSRLRNVLGNDELSSAGRAVRVGVVVVFVALAAVASVGIRRRQAPLIWVLIVWTIGYWLVRHSGILFGDYSAGFKLVHTALAVVSLGLAGLSARRLLGDRSVSASG